MKPSEWNRSAWNTNIQQIPGQPVSSLDPKSYVLCCTLDCICFYTPLTLVESNSCRLHMATRHIPPLIIEKNFTDDNGIVRTKNVDLTHQTGEWFWQSHSTNTTIVPVLFPKKRGILACHTMAQCLMKNDVVNHATEWTCSKYLQITSIDDVYSHFGWLKLMFFCCFYGPFCAAPVTIFRSSRPSPAHANARGTASARAPCRSDPHKNSDLSMAGSLLRTITNEKRWFNIG